MVLNVHTRELGASLAQVGPLIDDLASSHDYLWPSKCWPAMRFDRPLGVGAVGGHGPIRYTVEAYKPGCAVAFHFTGPRGFHGTHGFEFQEAGAQAVRLRHVLSMRDGIGFSLGAHLWSGVIMAPSCLR